MLSSVKSLIAAMVAASAVASAASIADLCTVSNVQAALSTSDTGLNIALDLTATTANVVYNASASAGFGPAAAGSSTTGPTYDYCNATITYSHTWNNNSVLVKYALPDPTTFKNRFYVAGGGGYSLSSSATGGLQYGAASGATDAGYDAFSVSFDEVVLYGNGSINWDATDMFGYRALGELTVLGKLLTKGFYGLGNGTRVYTYFEGCSDGGRQGMSQIQRWGEEYDGAIAGAPAFRYAQQQVNHVFPAMVEQTLGYYPPPCELSTILSATISACDTLDGREDGVVSRTDLCMLNFNLSSIVDTPYYCVAQNSSSLGFGFNKRQAPGSTTSSEPEQNGTVSAAGVAVVQAILDGLHSSSGDRAYLSWQITADLGDADTIYNTTSGAWELSIPAIGGEFVAKFIELVDLSNISNLDNATYDTLIHWMDVAMHRYYRSLQTTVPDLTPFQSTGGKLLHYHGESDGSVPAASSVHYWQSVCSVMYGNMTELACREQLADWYQLYLVPGAAHCGVNSLQPGVYPRNNMQTMIDWVEGGVKPTGLNATATSGAYSGETQMLCQWPLRPLWSSNSTSTFDCVYDQASVDSWTYSFPAFKQPVY